MKFFVTAVFVALVVAIPTFIVIWHPHSVSEQLGTEATYGLHWDLGYGVEAIFDNGAFLGVYRTFQSPCQQVVLSATADSRYSQTIMKKPLIENSSSFNIFETSNCFPPPN